MFHWTTVYVRTYGADSFRAVRYILLIVEATQDDSDSAYVAHRSDHGRQLTPEVREAA